MTVLPAGAGVVVTGAGNGIGRALATRLAAGGLRVLPHPVVVDYCRARAMDTDRWLHGKSKLQQGLERKEAAR